MKHRIAKLTVLAMFVVMVGYSGAASAQFVEGSPRLPVVSTQFVVNGDHCMVMPGGQVADNGDEVWITAVGCSPSDNETAAWDYDNNDHTLRLHARPDKCVSIPPAQMNSNLAKVQLWDCWQGASQKFDLVYPRKDGFNEYAVTHTKIRSAGGKCLSPMWNKGRMSTWDCEGATEFLIRPSFP